ncbi:MAG: hypothetical protein ACTSRU_16955, partial [Candidatus Hodarchaeales archaeon]
MILPSPRFILKYLLWQKRDLLFSLLGLLILCSLINCSGLIVSGIESIENDRFMGKFSSSLVINGFNDNKWDITAKLVPQFDEQIEKVYPLVSIARSEDKPGGAMIYSELCSWVLYHRPRPSTLHYALSNLTLHELLLDGGVFSI